MDEIRDADIRATVEVQIVHELTITVVADHNMQLSNFVDSARAKVAEILDKVSLPQTLRRKNIRVVAVKLNE